MKPSKLLLLSASLAAAAVVTRAEIVERVVARVNGDIVSLSEFEARQLAAVQQGKIPPAQIETFLRENNARLLQEAIDDMLILQRGEELGIRLRPEYVQEVIDGIKKENNIADDTELQQQLRREGMTIDDLKRNIERSIVRRQVLTRELESKATVNEADARAEYERDKSPYTRRASVHLHEIVVPDEEQARALIARVRAGEDFEALARANSTASTRDAGGDLGVLHRGEMNAAIEQSAFALAEGGVSDPLPTEGGYRILRATEKKEGSVATFAEVKDEIVKRLSQERATKAYDAYVEGLRKNAVTQTMVTEVPLQLSLPAAGASLVPPSGNAPAARAADPNAEFVITPQARPERVAPPAAPAARPRPRPRPRLRLRPSARHVDGSDFFGRVYAAVRAIPRGRVATYGQVAAALGVPRGARAVGWALRALSPSRERSVPWHRVVGAGGRISPRAGPGPLLQRERLRAEGVAFRGAAVDLRRHGVFR